MNLLVVRHGLAEDREAFKRTGRSDDLRPLTDRGRRRMRRNARGLAKVIRPDLLVTSPLTRAVQTAEILSAAFELEVATTLEALRPDESPDPLGSAVGGGRQHMDKVTEGGSETAGEPEAVPGPDTGPGPDEEGGR